MYQRSRNLRHKNIQRAFPLMPPLLISIFLVFITLFFILGDTFPQSSALLKQQTLSSLAPDRAYADENNNSQKSHATSSLTIDSMTPFLPSDTALNNYLKQQEAHNNSAPQNANSSPTNNQQTSSNSSQSSDLWTAKITIRNNRKKTLPVGIIEARISSSTILSTADLQSWEEGSSDFNPQLIVAWNKIPSLQSNQSFTVTMHAGNAFLKMIANGIRWGAKPLKFTYYTEPNFSQLAQLNKRNQNDSYTNSQNQNNSSLPDLSNWKRETSLNTVITKTYTPSSAQTNNSNNSQSQTNSSSLPLGIVPLLPLINVYSSQSSSANLNPQALKDLIEYGKSVSFNSLKPLSSLERHKINDIFKLVHDFPSLQVSVNPAFGAAVEKTKELKDIPFSQNFSSRIAAVTQPVGFDITASTLLPEKYWSHSGITPSLWNSTSAIHDAGGLNPSPSVSPNANQPSLIAWAANIPWTRQGIYAAVKQGYKTIYAPAALPVSANAPVQSGRFSIWTPYGMATVITPQLSLSALSQNAPTSSLALSEKTEAGRITRLVAQSAIYQLQSPSRQRTLMISFGDKPETSFVSTVMNTLKQCPWIKLTSLHTFLSTKDLGNTSYRLANISSFLTSLKEKNMPASYRLAFESSLKKIKKNSDSSHALLEDLYSERARTSSSPESSSQDNAGTSLNGDVSLSNSISQTLFNGLYLLNEPLRKIHTMKNNFFITKNSSTQSSSPSSSSGNNSQPSSSSTSQSQISSSSPRSSNSSNSSNSTKSPNNSDTSTIEPAPTYPSSKPPTHTPIKSIDVATWENQISQIVRSLIFNAFGGSSPSLNAGNLIKRTGYSLSSQNFYTSHDNQRDSDYDAHKNSQNDSQENPESKSQNTPASFEEKIARSIPPLESTFVNFKTFSLATTALDNQLTNALSIKAPISINVFSKSAQMPVTYTNLTPFAVALTPKATTGSAATRISGGHLLTLSPGSEVQQIYTISTIGATEVDAIFTIEGKNNIPWSNSVHTRINTQLTLSEMSGNFFLIAAVILFALGLWRQIKKIRKNKKIK